MRDQALLAVLTSIFWTAAALSQDLNDSKIFEASPIASHQIAIMEASRAARLDSLRRALRLSSTLRLNWKTSDNGFDTFEVIDDFNREEIGTDWAYDPRYWAIVDGELSTTANATQEWQYLAAFLPIHNDDEHRIYSVSYRWGKYADSTGIREGAMVLMLDKPAPDASGYWLWQRFGSVWLWIVKNGGWEYTPGQGKEVEVVSGQIYGLMAGDVVTGVVRDEADAVYFDYYVNGEFDATVKDVTKEFPVNNVWHVGVFMYGQQLHNQVDDFTVTWIRDDREPPATVTDLKVSRVYASSVTLEWTSSGDNGWDGRAKRIDLRYSTSPITPENYSSATRVSRLPAPVDPGQHQRFTVSGLQEHTTYYFALRIIDEVNNASGISNVVEAGTPAMTVRSDNFNRADGNLGEDWGGDLTNLQIRNNAVENVKLDASRSAAVYRGCRNVIEVTLKYGPAAASSSISSGGILVMADSPAATANGYLIQHDDTNTPNNRSDDRTRLWLVKNGQPISVIQEGQSQSPPPRSGSSMNVQIVDVNGVRNFYVYVDGILDRILSDPNRLQNGAYAGFLLKSGQGEQNAVDEFTARASRSAPKALNKISGDNQVGELGQPLPLPLTVALIDSFDNPISDAVIGFAVTSGTAIIPSPPSQDGNIRLEAEEAKITAPLEMCLGAAASGGQYVVYPVGQTADASATFTFEVEHTGTYRIWTRSMKTGSQPGSWFISVDGEADFIYDVFQNTTYSTWTWDLVSERGGGTPAQPKYDPKLFYFWAGNHTVVFNARWEDTRLDKILITSDANYVPKGKEENFFTDASGQASAEVIWGDKAGLVTIQASYGNLPSVAFTATVGSIASKLVMYGGGGQSGPAGQPLPQPFKVMVQDNNGIGVAGQLVNWVVTAGNGTLSQYTSLSDNNGIAATVLTLGNWSATNKVEARAAFASTPIVFTATTSSGVANKAAVISGNSQTGVVHTTLPAPLVVKVTTVGGQAVANFPVEFRVTRGGGSLSPNLAIRNQGFELAKPGTNTPANWTLEGAPSANEVLLSTTGPWKGVKSLEIKTSRAGVGVSQIVNYPVAGNYTLNFYVKVISGRMRLVWSLNDTTPQVGGNRTIDITSTATGNNWTPYVISANNPASGTTPQSLSFKTLGGGAHFFIDEVNILRNTDSQGEISVNWTLGDTAMTQAVVAAAKAGSTHLTGSPLTISATAKPGPAKKLAVASGNNQNGTAGQALSAPLVVKVADAYGNGIANRSIKFTVKAGGGKLNGDLTTYSINTNQNGLAEAKLTLGPAAGDTNKVEVTTTGLSAVIFSAIAAIPSKVTKVAGAPTVGSAGHRLNNPLVVRVMDANSKTISGCPVIFKFRQGNGTINGVTQTIVRTDSVGEARAYPVLGPAPGAQNRIDAWVNANGTILPSPVLTFIVTAAKLKKLALILGNNQTGTVGEPLAQPFKVKVLDSLGVGIQSQAVKFQITLGGGKLDGIDTVKSVQTDSLGIARTRLTLGPQPGTNQVTASTATALTGSPMLFVANAVSSMKTQIPTRISVTLKNDEVRGVKCVTLEWWTPQSGELNRVGFNVLRSVGWNSSSEGYERINRELIPAHHDSQYVFVDDKVEAGSRYFYMLEDVDGDGQVTLHGPIEIEVTAPKTFTLQQNYPNPFSARGTPTGVAFGNPTTQIRYELPRPAQVTLTIYNALGQEVCKLVDGQQPAGYHLAMWNGRDQQGKPVPSGIYHYRLQVKDSSGADEFVMTKKMMMTK